MNETHLTIFCPKNKEQIELCDSDEISNFFSSYICPGCHKCIYENDDSGFRCIHFYSITYEPFNYNLEKEKLDFTNLSDYISLDDACDFYNCISSADIEYQKIIYSIIKNRIISQIDVHSSCHNVSFYDSKSHIVSICGKCNSNTIYHEFGHAIYGKYPDLFTQFNKITLSSCGRIAKNAIHQYMDDKYHFKRIYTDSCKEAKKIISTLSHGEKKKYEGILSFEQCYTLFVEHGSGGNAILKNAAVELYKYISPRYVVLMDFLAMVTKGSKRENIYWNAPGRSKNYWKRKDAKQQEAFANIFCLYATEDNELIDVLENIFPQLFDEYKRVIFNVKYRLIKEYGKIYF